MVWGDFGYDFSLRFEESRLMSLLLGHRVRTTQAPRVERFNDSPPLPFHFPQPLFSPLGLVDELARCRTSSYPPARANFELIPCLASSGCATPDGLPWSSRYGAHVDANLRGDCIRGLNQAFFYIRAASPSSHA
eukprot:1190852-Prorocentrum_minimum.AAC.4